VSSTCIVLTHAKYSALPKCSEHDLGRNRHSEQHVTQVRKRARTWFNSPSDILMKVMCWGQDRFKQCSLVCGQFANREEDLLLNGHLCDFLAPSAAPSSCQTTLQCMASCEDPRRFIDFEQNLINHEPECIKKKNSRRRRAPTEQ